MKLIIAGSRVIDDKYVVADFVAGALDEWGLVVGDVSEIVSGGAKGVDWCGEEFAYSNRIMVKKFAAEGR